jgi:hypothetical protein
MIDDSGVSEYIVTWIMCVCVNVKEIDVTSVQRFMLMRCDTVQKYEYEYEAKEGILRLLSDTNINLHV